MPVVLIVDGNVNLSRKLGEALIGKMAGLEVMFARTCSQARKMATERAPQVVISDWLLPDGSGFTLMLDIHAACDAVPFILLSEESSSEFRAKAISHGAFDVLIKHVDSREVLSTICRALGSNETDLEADGMTGVVDTAPILDGFSVLLVDLRLLEVDLHHLAGDADSVNRLVDERFEALAETVLEIRDMIERLAGEDGLLRR